MLAVKYVQVGNFWHKVEKYLTTCFAMNSIEEWTTPVEVPPVLQQLDWNCAWKSLFKTWRPWLLKLQQSSAHFSILWNTFQCRALSHSLPISKATRLCLQNISFDLHQHCLENRRRKTLPSSWTFFQNTSPKLKDKLENLPQAKM